MSPFFDRRALLGHGAKSLALLGVGALSIPGAADAGKDRRKIVIRVKGWP
jgi:hypothetical protein